MLGLHAVTNAAVGLFPVLLEEAQSALPLWCAIALAGLFALALIAHTRADWGTSLPHETNVGWPLTTCSRGGRRPVTREPVETLVNTDGGRPSQHRRLVLEHGHYLIAERSEDFDRLKIDE